MPGVSHTGNVYEMNIIDDFSSYIWCVPLKCRSDASMALQTWHCTVTTQSSLTLKILVTDNGELISASTSHWCDTHGINHQCTVPYTSAQNGHAKHLHCMLFRCTCTMHLACNAPISLWDEFCLTTVYLTNLTATSANHNKTPFELWYSKAPYGNQLLANLLANASPLDSPEVTPGDRGNMTLFGGLPDSHNVCDA